MPPLSLPFFLSLLLAIQSPHEPISIASDDDLRTPDAVSGNGVRSGTGTELDPYVIADWTILAEPGRPALDVRNTNSFLRVENITIRGGGATDTVVRIEQGQHIDLRSIAIDQGSVHTTLGGQLEIDRLIIGHGDLLTSSTPFVQVTASQLGDGSIRVGNPTSVHVRGNLVHPHDGTRAGIGIDFQEAFVGGEASVCDNRVFDAPGRAIEVLAASKASVCRNIVQDALGTAIFVGDGPQLRTRAEIWNNTVRNAGGYALEYNHASAWAIIHNNTLLGSAAGIFATWERGEIRDNTVANNEIGLWIVAFAEPSSDIVEHNRFVDNAQSVEANQFIRYDVSKNWWGVADDPLAAAAQGKIGGFRGDLQLAPWCATSSCWSYAGSDDAQLPAWSWWGVALAVTAVAFIRRRSP